jgi:hypothetical protein
MTRTAIGRPVTRAAPVVVWGAALLVGGCVGDREAATSAGAVSSGAAASDGVSETGAVTTTDAGTSTTTVEPVPTTSSSTGSSGDATGGFIVAPDGGGVEECDLYAQDCDEGEKCASWAEGGGSAWNATKCVPVMGDQQPGEPCTAVGGGVSGLDDCIEGAMCWDVDAENQGECVAVCTGSEREPMCEDTQLGCGVTRCAVLGEGVLAICLPTCEPLTQNCPGDDLCLPVSGTYLCVLDASGDLGAAFDPCEFANQCDKGLLCAEPTAAPECDQGATGCCVPMCSIAAGDELCPGVGQQCVPIYDPPMSGCEDVGSCMVMP